MKRMLGAIAGYMLALAGAAAPASAQIPVVGNPVSFGLAGGITNPVGDRLEAYDMGYSISGTVGLQPALLPIGFRLAINYQTLGHDVEDMKLLGGDVNAIYRLGGLGIRPYLTGGVGLYNVDFGVGDAETKFALNGGGGLEFPLGAMSTYVEARWNVIFHDESINSVPVVFGVRF